MARPNYHLTLDVRKFLIKHDWKHDSTREVQRLWEITYQSTPPTYKTIQRIVEEFDETGFVQNAPKSGRRRDATNDDQKLDVAFAFTASESKEIDAKSCR